jgi:hypothetical protein
MSTNVYTGAGYTIIEDAIKVTYQNHFEGMKTQLATGRIVAKGHGTTQVTVVVLGHFHSHSHLHPLQ